MSHVVLIGFVHRSQMSNTLVEQPDEVVTVGEQIFCKVISAEVFVAVFLHKACSDIRLTESQLWPNDQ